MLGTRWRFAPRRGRTIRPWAGLVPPRGRRPASGPRSHRRLRSLPSPPAPVRPVTSSPGRSVAGTSDWTTCPSLVSAMSSSTSASPHDVTQSSRPLTTHPDAARSARTLGGPGRRRWANATAPRAAPEASGRAHRSRSSTLPVVSATSVGDRCCVATNHSAPEAPDSCSTSSRTTAGGAPPPPTATGAHAPRNPASASVRTCALVTPSTSITSASAATDANSGAAAPTSG